MLLKLLYPTAFAPCLQAKSMWDSCFSLFLLGLRNCVLTCVLEHLALRLGLKRGEKLYLIVREEVSLG